MECLKRADGEKPIKTEVYIEDLGHVKVVHSEGQVSQNIASLTEIAVECASNEAVENLREFLVMRYMVDVARGNMDPLQAMHGVFSSGFAYGLRAGIEMERQELPEVPDVEIPSR